MNLSEQLKQRYTKDTVPASEAQRLAEFIVWGPIVFQASRLMVKFGILEIIQDSKEGLTRAEVVDKTALSDYAVKCLLEASLSIGLIILDMQTDRYSISKTGWFLLNDEATRINLDFNHYVNYAGMFDLEKALLEGRPAGLKHIGDWPTLYEGLSEFPDDIQRSWLAFDHFYSDGSFPEALEIVFGKHKVSSLYDVGGNTGKWALKCVQHDKNVHVTVLDLPQQLKMMRESTCGKAGADRITGYGINLLDKNAAFPKSNNAPDAIWMSQFLDCFSMEEITGILSRAKEVMDENTCLYIMETLWDRQKFEPAALCLTMTSLYFTDIANGNSKMYNTEDISECIENAGLGIESIHDQLGLGHSIIVCKTR